MFQLLIRTGHASMIGRTTGKVISYAVRCKKCRSCAKDDNNNDHDCRRNWDKSSKAMESDMAIEMLHELKAKDFHVKNIIMDNDATTINSIPCHVFGDHSLCSEDWCGYIKDPENYKPRNLPYGKYLTGEDLLKDLKALFSLFSNNAEKLCSTGSTQSNENFNRVLSAKNPKTYFYGGSESTSFRVAAAVAQKNIGYESLLKVCFF